MQRLGTEDISRRVCARWLVEVAPALSFNRALPIPRRCDTPSIPPSTDPLPSSCRRARGAVRHRVASVAHSIHAPPDRLTAATAACTRAHTLITTLPLTHVYPRIPVITRLRCYHTWPAGVYDDKQASPSHGYARERILLPLFLYIYLSQRKHECANEDTFAC